MGKLKYEILIRYLDGSCSPEELQIIDKWANESEENADALFRLEEMYHMRRYDNYNDKKKVSRAWGVLCSEISGGHKKRSRLAVSCSWMKYAAVIIIFISIVSGLELFMKDKWQAGRMVVVRTDTASIKQINLPDGSVVWLNRSTKLTYPKKFSDAERLIKLDGEAFFDVSKNPDKPFVVKSDALTVKVLGTEFNFNGRKSVNMASVSLLAGSVRASGNHNEGLIVLSPNQKVVLNKLTGQMTVQLMNTKLDAVWHNNLIPFKNANINEIAKTLERFYKVRITVSSDIDKSITYSGVIEREDAIDSVLTVLSYTIPFKINIHGNDIQLSGCDR